MIKPMAEMTREDMEGHVRRLVAALGELTPPGAAGIIVQFDAGTPVAFASNVPAADATRALRVAADLVDEVDGSPWPPTTPAPGAALTIHDFDI